VKGRGISEEDSDGAAVPPDNCVDEASEDTFPFCTNEDDDDDGGNAVQTKSVFK